MSQREITLPSGAAVVVRGLTVREMNRWAVQSRKDGGQGAASTSTFNDVLANCTVRIAHSGPAYPNGLTWDKALVADRFCALLQIRCATYEPDPYVFRHQCAQPQEGGCGKLFTQKVDLEKDGDLKYVAIPEASIAHFIAGNRIPLTLPSGQQLAFRLQIPEDEIRVRKLMDQYADQPMTAAILARLVEVKGMEPNDWAGWIEDMGLRDFNFIRHAMDKADGGVDTSLDLRCPHCGHVNMDVALPFGTRFFLPDSQ